MIKVMSFYSGVRTRHIYGWVSVVWFTTAVSFAVSEGVELNATDKVAARCGDNVTLTCEVISSHQVDIKLFQWLAKNKTKSKRCQYDVDQSYPEVLCESTKTPHPTLTLTLLNVMPVDQGTYLCKLHSTKGVKDATTAVTVQDCFGSSDYSINASHAKCWFIGVYPRGIVHWFQGNVNLTDSASTQEEEDQHGRYSVWSTIDVQEGNSSLPYECSLWIPSVEVHRPGHKLPLIKSQDSSGNMVTLQWICIMVEIMMVKFMT